MNKQKKLSSINIEILIVVIIAICVLFLHAFTSAKLNELDRAGSEAMFIKDGLEYTDSEQLGEEIIKYRPDSCKMIEMYDETFELLFSLQFDEKYPMHDNNIAEHPELLEYLQKSEEGQTSINIQGYEEDVYFQWVLNNRNEKRLVIVYSTKPVVDDLWIFSFVCYTIIILVFILLIVIHTKNYRDKICQYENITNNFRDEINRK
jgi:hypothetical protein